MRMGRSGDQTTESATHAEQARFQVSHPHSIERILREVMERKTVVSLQLEGASDFMLSSILEVAPEHGLLWLDQGVDQDFNARLVEAGHVVCSTSHHQVHIQFSGAHLKSVTRRDAPSFQVDMPKSLLRLQRRDAYRLETSMVNPVKCEVNTGAGLIDTVVIDISVGGVGILAYQGKGVLKPGETYHGCRLDLHGTGLFAVSLAVCSTFDVVLKNGKLTHRVGCRFIDLPASVETEIQRYINKVERERRSRYI